MADPVMASAVVPRATRGARVGGLFVGGCHAALASNFYVWQPDDMPAWLYGLWFAIGLFVAIRPWWLYVEITEDGFDVNSWFRKYRFRRGEVDSIDIIRVTSMGFGFAVGFIPFVGSVRMIEVVARNGKATWLPCLVGRRNAVLRLARTLRVQVGLSSTHSLLND